MPHTSWSDYHARRLADATPEELALREWARAKVKRDIERYERSRLYRAIVWWRWRDLHWHNLKARMRGTH